MQKSILCLSLFFIICNSYSQSSINGTLKTEYGVPVSGASVTITELNTDNILKYDISNGKGFFTIYLNSKLEKLQLNIRSMGYKSVIRVISNNTQTIDFVMEEELTELKELIIKSSPITRKGDTINYSVKTFTKQEDRTIADVLKSMPGIEVLGDGKILYQGKPINKYYIEGLDLLEGKYNLANSNLPHKEVAKVQVIENHQPIKILDNLVYSEQAAINIKLKKSHTFTGQAKLGIGVSPPLWDVNLTPMLFSKKKQILNSYQANNAGNNVASQSKTLTIEELLEQFERSDEKLDWLAIQQISVPNISEPLWLDNNAHLFTTNYLQKLKNDYELRLNIWYLNDYQQQMGVTNTQFFVVNDTIALFEKSYNQLYINSLETSLTLQKNTKKKYFKNTLKFNGFWNSERGIIEVNDSKVTQNLSNRYFKLSNVLKTLFPLGNHILTLNSYIGLNRTPQSLVVEPGQFSELLNSGNRFDEVTQDVELITIYTNNSLGFTKTWKQFSFSPKVGFQIERQDLGSQILTSSENIVSNFENNLDWTRSKLYSSLQTQFKKDKWRTELNTPIYYHSYQLEDNTIQHTQNLARITFEPRASVTYDLTSFWRLDSNINLSNQFGRINQVYYNYILQNYRNIQRIDAPLPQEQSFGYSASIGYRNPIKSLFFSLNYNNVIADNNLMYKNYILDNGATELQAVEQDNKRLSREFMTRLSKYFSDLSTTTTLSAHYSLQDFKQLLNSEITDITNRIWHLNGKIATDITDWFYTEIESMFQFSNNQIQNQNNQTISQQFHKFNFNIYPKENQYLGLKTEFVKTNLFSESNENFFAELVYRYTWKKKDIDFELQLNNIFNTDMYRTVSINDFIYVESNFNIRPRQLIFKIRMSI